MNEVLNHEYFWNSIYINGCVGIQTVSEPLSNSTSGDTHVQIYNGAALSSDGDSFIDTGVKPNSRNKVVILGECIVP